MNRQTQPHFGLGHGLSVTSDNKHLVSIFSRILTDQSLSDGSKKQFHLRAAWYLQMLRLIFKRIIVLSHWLLLF